MPPGSLVAIGCLLLVLTASSALFSAIETALFSLLPQHLDRLKKRSERFGPALARIMENPRRLLSAILLADSLVNLPLIILCLWLLRTRLATAVPFWVAALLIFALVVFVCDLVPKLLALADSQRFARLGVAVMQVIMPVVDPIARALQRISERLADAITPSSIQPIPYLSEDELETLVELSTEEGTLHASESEMIQEIIKLGNKTAKDCMTPRVDTFALPDDLARDEIIPKLRDRRYRRVPIYGETPDDILGVLDVPRFLLNPDIPYHERLIPPSFVAETMKAIDLLRAFLSHPQGIAFVVDEHGGIEGVVTLADIVEEIISDAVPVAERALYLETMGDGTLLANGSARLEDVNEILHTELEEEGIDTIGGLIFNHHGALPRPGAQLEIDGLRITIRRTSRKRIEEILIAPPATGNEEEVGT